MLPAARSESGHVANGPILPTGGRRDCRCCRACAFASDNRAAFDTEFPSLCRAGGRGCASAAPPLGPRPHKGGTFLRCASTWTQQKEGRDSRIGEKERLTYAQGKPVLAKSKQPAEAAQFETSALSGAV
ncbi:hypothetical protein SRHO_G00023820 [Serrasalmus rhombeus]